MVSRSLASVAIHDKVEFVHGANLLRALIMICHIEPRLDRQTIIKEDTMFYPGSWVGGNMRKVN